MQVVFLSNPYEANNTKFCTNLIYTAHDAYVTSWIVTVTLFIIRGAQLVELLMM